MDLSRQEYPALLASLQPNQAINVLNDRIRVINKINADIADWLQERRRVEEAYAQGLRKLAHRPQLDNGAVLGIFQIPWQRIINATEAVASSHEVLAQKIEEDVERPLREYSSKNRELSSMPGVQSDLATLVKGFDVAQKKVEKARDKGPKGADRLASAISAAEAVREQWETRAPFVFEQLQAADEGRLNHLRDVLTQLQTHESDHVERSRQAAESCLNVLLNVETADEIKTFAAKVNGGRPVARRQESIPASAPPLAPPPRIQDDAASQRSGSSGIARPPPVPEPRNTALGGLKRLGTVMGRRKSIVHTGGGAPFFSDKKHRSPFASFKRGDSRDMPIPESPTETDRPATALTTQDSHGEAASIRNEIRERELPASPPMSPEPRIQQAPVATNGAPPPEVQNEPPLPALPPVHEPQVDSEGFTEKPQTIDEITRLQREAAGLDDQGMNLTIRDQPILEDESQAKQAMNEMASQLRLQAQHSGVRRNASTLRGRRDVRNTVFIPNPPGSSHGPPTLASGFDVSAPTSPGLPIKHITSPSAVTDDHTMSDTTSIRSSHTLHSISGPVSHPDLHQPGLNASIIETVSAWFTEGAVTKSFVVGELSLAYNPPSGTNADHARVRLDNFQVLEKVAANPHFVKDEKDQGDENRGEYNILLANISRPSPTVAFKYQVHVDPSDLSAYCPVIFKPAWNLEEFQASVIIFYSMNPSFASSVPRESITLKNLTLTVNLDTSSEGGREGAHATSAVMYPNTGAAFRRKQSAVTWKIPELEVPAGTGGKLLVRFATSTSWPRKGKVDAKFELRTADAGSRLGISTVSPSEGTSSKESDPFADESAATQALESQSLAIWKALPTMRKLVAGKYVSF